MVPEFLELHPQVMPCLLQMLISYIEEAPKSQDASLTAEKALYAMAEFAANMEEHEINPYLIAGMEVILKYLNGPG